ncbi:MAG: prolipoprotein diacylglyceryl transferase [Desulfobacterales bacterium GWB2_56_26]|nr:MAG: prolipoprotein diacylglyceryl transferase [Desulfobacterales bacterium GWB2_56_26]
MAAFVFPEIDPVIFQIGPLAVRWYGLMYVLGFLASYYLVRRQIREFSYHRLNDHFENLNMVLILAVIVGGRLGYVLFYNLSYYLAHPLEILATWSGGMSFHGGCIAALLGGWLYCRIKALDFWKTADIYTATIPIGLGLGRIGNFINGELYGRVTDVPWAMVFPGGGPLPRHPSQLYESLLEGLLLFTVLWTLRRKPWQNNRLWPHGSIFALFLSGYGCIRIIVEGFREPDQQIGYLLGFLTMGQVLSGAMVIGGLVIWKFRMGGK